MVAASVVSTALPAHRSGHGLERGFYADPAVFAAEMEAIFAKGWMFAGHSCEIPKPGDWFTHDIGDDSAIVVRGQDGKIRAFFNVCRHRGSRICAAPSGHSGAFVCPYHAWAYDLQGRCLRDTASEHGVPPGELGLRPVQLREVGGLIFICLSSAPPDFFAAEKILAPALKPQGLTRAKIATVADYTVNANWKIIFENNRECMHCPTAHKEYIGANYDIQLGDPRHAKEIEARMAECAAIWKAKGLEAPTLKSDMTGAWYRANRTPLKPGWVSETLDGKRTAPLMGDYPDEEVGTLRATVFASFWMHGSCDHAVTTRVTPAGPRETRVRVYWLVNEKAEEGRDYELARLMPFWQRTSEQDWALVENVQRGVLSRGYSPGPLSKTRETNVAHFIDWYLEQLRGGPAA